MSELTDYWKSLAARYEEGFEIRGKQLEQLSTKCAELERQAATLTSDGCEWLCERCNVIYPTQRVGKLYQPCPVCSQITKYDNANALIPTSLNLRTINEQSKQLAAQQQQIRSLREALGYVRNFDYQGKCNKDPLNRHYHDVIEQALAQPFDTSALDKYRDEVLENWDDLLEDLELHGMHDFEPYIKSKEKFRRMKKGKP